MPRKNKQASHSTTRQRRRGRPTLDQEREITDAIIDTALALFLELGYTGASMQRIGKDAAVSPGTLYARFRNKADLFQAAIRHQVDLWHQQFPNRIPTADISLEDALAEEVLHLMEAHDREDVTAVNRLLWAEAGRFPELGRIYYDTAVRFGIDATIEAILATKDGQSLGEQHSRELAQTLHETVNGWVLQQVMRGGAGSNLPERRKAAKRMARILARPQPPLNQ